MQIKWPAMAGVSVVAGIAISLALRHAMPVAAQIAPAPQPIPTVSVVAAEQRDLPILVKASGRVEAKASVIVKSRLDGQVSALVFTEGGAVRQGQVLLRMDAGPAEAQLRQAQALLARDDAQLSRLIGDSRRNTALYEQGFISQSGLSQTEADLHAAQATLKADQASLDNARLQLAFTTITAPVDGVAGAALLPVGGAAKANDTALVVINQIRPIYVSFAVPETELARLKHAMAQGAVPVTTQVSGSAAMVGRLVFLDNAVDPASGTFMAKAAFANQGGELMPGQFAEVQLPVEHLGNAIVVPAAAVESGLDGSFVFVVKPDATVEIRPVKVATEVDGFSAIAAGLALGERVVTAGQAHLRAGSRVSTASQ